MFPLKMWTELKYQNIINHWQCSCWRCGLNSNIRTLSITDNVPAEDVDWTQISEHYQSLTMFLLTMWTELKYQNIINHWQCSRWRCGLNSNIRTLSITDNVPADDVDCTQISEHYQSLAMFPLKMWTELKYQNIINHWQCSCWRCGLHSNIRTLSITDNVPAEDVDWTQISEHYQSLTMFLLTMWTELKYQNIINHWQCSCWRCGLHSNIRTLSITDNVPAEDVDWTQISEHYQSLTMFLLTMWTELKYQNIINHWQCSCWRCRLNSNIRTLSITDNVPAEDVDWTQISEHYQSLTMFLLKMWTELKYQNIINHWQCSRWRCGLNSNIRTLSITDNVPAEDVDWTQISEHYQSLTMFLLKM